MRLASGIILPSRRRPRALAGGGSQPTLSQSGLVAWNPFNGTGVDKSGNGHTMSLVGGPVYIAGPTYGQALELNFAASEYATSPASPSFGSTAAFTVGGWFRSNDLGQDTGIFQKSSGGNGIVVHWENSGSFWRTVMNVTNSADPADTGADWAADDVWRQFYVTRSGAGANTLVYRNAGTPITLITATVINLAASANQEVGRKFAGFGELDVCEWTYWSRALSAAEIAVLFNGGSRLTYDDILWT